MRNGPYWLNIGSILYQYGCATREAWFCDSKCRMFSLVGLQSVYDASKKLCKRSYSITERLIGAGVLQTDLSSSEIEGQLSLSLNPFISLSMPCLLDCIVAVCRYTEIPNRYPIFSNTDTDTPLLYLI